MSGHSHLCILRYQWLPQGPFPRKNVWQTESRPWVGVAAWPPHPSSFLSSPFLPFTHHFSSGKPGWGKASPAQHNFPRPRSLGRSEPQAAAAAACHSPCCTPATFTNGASLTHPSWQLQEVGNAEPYATRGEIEPQRREVTCLRMVNLELDPIPAPCHLWISVLSQTRLLISSGARGAQEELHGAFGVKASLAKGVPAPPVRAGEGNLGPCGCLGAPGQRGCSLRREFRLILSYGIGLPSRSYRLVGERPTNRWAAVWWAGGFEATGV